MNKIKRIQHFHNETEKKFSEWIISILKENPYIPWDYFNTFSINPNIIMDIIKANPDISWDFQLLSENKNITWDIVKNNLDKNWNWYELSRHIFTKDKELFFEKEYRKHMALYRIDSWLSGIVLCPHTKWGKKHLERKINMLYDK